MLSKFFLANITGVWPLSGVHALVHNQSCPFVECFVTNVTFQCLFAAVQLQVILKGSLGRHALAAQGTLVLVLAYVGLYMHYQGVFVGKCLSAKFALMLDGFVVWIVHLDVPRQGVLVGAGFVASLTDVLLGAVLHVHMAVQLCIGEEALLANLAKL